jgi:glycosyltransferase involved in cell wall biosynthesis
VSLFEQLYREQGIDLVHANTITLSDPLIAAQRVGIPAISHARELISLDEDLASQLGATPTEIAKTVCQNATYVLANSAATLADYPCGDSGGYIHNSIDASAFDFPNTVDPNCIKVGLVSSNILKKGIFDFLELARRAEKLLPVLQFYLIGPETRFTREWRLAPQLLPANFHLAGYFLQPPEAYRDLNLVLNLSRFAESFGRTVAEGMAARRPVIAYRYGALPELIDEGETGFLVPYLDLAAVLDRLGIFVEHPERIHELGETARARAIERFSREAFGSAINALYERLITEAKSRA